MEIKQQVKKNKSKTKSKNIQNSLMKKIRLFFRFKWLRPLWKNVKLFFGMRQTKYSSNTFISIVALLGILILLNIIADKESANTRFDITKDKQYSISDQSEKIISNINEEVKITAFFAGTNPSREDAESLLKEYEARNSLISFEIIDFNEKPALAERYEIERDGVIIFEKGDKRERSTSASESEITSALLKVNSDKKKVVYFITDHGEKDINNFEESGYSNIKTVLEKDNFIVKSISLLKKGEIPSDASLIVIASPQKALTEKEVNSIKEYLDKNGKLFILLDPATDDLVVNNMSEIVSNWGLKVENGIVVDTESYFYGDVLSPVINKWNSHQITESLSAAFFPGVISIDESDTTPDNVIIQTLAETSSKSWLKKDLNDPNPDQTQSDIQGPISFAVALKENTDSDEDTDETHTRIVILGDSDFAINKFSPVLGNLDLFANSVDWLLEEEELISIRPKEQSDRKVTLTGSQAQIIFYTTVIGMPVIILIAGILVWMKRKRNKQSKLKNN